MQVNTLLLVSNQRKIDLFTQALNVQHIAPVFSATDSLSALILWKNKKLDLVIMEWDLGLSDSARKALEFFSKNKTEQKNPQVSFYLIGGTENELNEISFQIQYIFPADATAQEISKAIAETL